MATKNFHCDACDNEGKISIKETQYISLVDIVCCPFCGSDIYDTEEEDIDD